jgi:DNA mismatch repair ATPase MutS
LGERLTQYLKEKIYKQIEDEFKDKIKLKKKDHEIVMIDYDSNQSEMIKLLKKRGKLIASMKDDTEITN